MVSINGDEMTKMARIAEPTSWALSATGSKSNRPRDPSFCIVAQGFHLQLKGYRQCGSGCVIWS